MTEVDRLLREYIERFESGGSSDPGDFLDQVEEADREKLAVLISGYLEHAAPAQGWDPEAFEGSLSERAVARVAETWSGASGELPVVLVQLRNERQITRADLVTRLADSLGVSAAREKVASYYHRLEHGLLPSEGVSGRVWDALGGLLQTSAESLREAGSRPGPGAGDHSAAAYARVAPPTPEEYARLADREAGQASPAQPEPEESDEVDRLFTGG